MKRAIGNTLVQVSAVAVLLGSGAAWAQIKVGVVVSATGPAASLGIPEKNTFGLMPKEIGGKTVEYIVLDDASDTTTAVKNTRKLISEDKVDVIIGSTVTPNSLAMLDVAAESETPMISMAASAAIVGPMDAKRHWVFKTLKMTRKWRRQLRRTWLILVSRPQHSLVFRMLTARVGSANFPSSPKHAT